MSLIPYLSSQLWALARVVPAIGTYQLQKKKAQSEAVGAMRKALNNTRIFLRNPDYTDLKQIAMISDLWNEASEKVGVVNVELGITLGEKSRFWSDIELFTYLGRDKEVMQLVDVVSEIDKLYNQMQ